MASVEGTPKLYWVIVLFVAIVGVLSGATAVALTAIAPTDDGGRYATLIEVFTETFKGSFLVLCGLLGGGALSQPNLFPRS